MNGSEHLGENRVAYVVDLRVFHRESVLRACHKFTARCHVHVGMGEAEDHLKVTLAAPDDSFDVRKLLGDFGNELIEQQLRQELADRTGSIRELLVAQAFAEGNLLDPERDDGDYREDPRGAGDRR